MKIVQDFQAVDLEHVALSSLIEFDHGDGLALGVPVYRDAMNDLFTVAVFGVRGSNVRPFVTNLAAYGYCLSYGTEWAVELRGTDSFTGDRSAGLIYIDANAPVLRFGAAPVGGIHRGPLHLNLATMKPTGTEGSGIPISHWAIWARQEHIGQPHREPLFVFNTNESKSASQ
ncbi:hypothetical protein [Aurantimonas sp. 22II-16-19i]|uniref:hypothetical protein n=1 Tax=Aurantimonas sp. 22II-16-19i TaxID=1317114 RepID=UPI00111C8653|nr:hypothetical protein [Aurantimonas sp. 22II-16-19i]